mmetsp:Transcript_20708/g.66200  ORF Transcript_20708/g.66200 Transcript_20708/m.66200 type:complete len:235 (-) Transcript_20708:342-1046(-)
MMMSTTARVCCIASRYSVMAASMKYSGRRKSIDVACDATSSSGARVTDSITGVESIAKSKSQTTMPHTATRSRVAPTPPHRRSRGSPPPPYTRQRPSCSGSHRNGMHVPKARSAQCASAPPAPSVPSELPARARGGGSGSSGKRSMRTAETRRKSAKRMLTHQKRSSSAAQKSSTSSRTPSEASTPAQTAVKCESSCRPSCRRSSRKTSRLSPVGEAAGGVPEEVQRRSRGRAS